MPTFVHGRSTVFYAGGYDLTSYFSEMKSANAVDKSAANTFGITSKTSVPGLKMPSLSGSGYWDATAGASHERLKTILGLVGQVFSIGKAGDAPGAVAELALGYGAKYEAGSKINDVVSADADIECSGGIDMLGYWLHEKKAETATNTGYTTVDRGVANTTSNGYSINLHVFAASGTSSPLLTVVVEHSTNGSTWATLDTFTAVASASAPIAEQKTGTTSVNRFVRVRWTEAGSSPSFTFAAGIGIR